MSSSESVSPILQIGDEIDGKFEVLAHLGSGGMGHVYKAMETALERVVAVKVLTRARIGAHGVRFRREARMLALLSHENVVMVHAYAEPPGAAPYIVMGHVAGETLKARLERKGALDAETFALIFHQICAGVSAAHDKGVVHRDIKPANILLTRAPDGSDLVKVADFGLASLFGSTGGAGGDVTAAHQVVGTLYYMSPEQLLGSGLDHRSDIYSLALVAYEMLTAASAYRATSEEELKHEKLTIGPRPISQIRPDLGFSIAVDSILRKAVERFPVARHRSVDELANELIEELLRWAGATGAPREPGSLPGRSFSDAPTLPVSWKGASVSAARSVTVLHLKLDVHAGRGTMTEEEYRECLSMIVQRSRQILATAGGSLIGWTTTGQRAVFGAEHPDQDHVRKAVEAGLELRAALESLSSGPGIPPAFRVSYRLGGDTGPLVHKSTSVCVGPPVSGARALAEVVEPGQLVISRDAHRRVSGMCDCRESRTGGLHAYVVLQKRLTFLLPIAGVHGVVVDLVGRAAELGQLADSLGAAVRDRRPVAVVLEGPAGVGKSRLVSELLQRLHGQDNKYYFEFGRCTPSSRVSVPYEPIFEALRRRAQIREDDSPATARMKFESFVQQHLATNPLHLDEDERRLAAELGAFIGVPDGDVLVSRSSTGPEARRRAMFEAVTEFYRRLSSRHPVIMVVDDFTWAAPGTRQIVEHVLEHIGQAPFFCVLVARSEGEEKRDTRRFRDAPYVTRLDVSPLSTPSADELTRLLLARLADPPEELLREIRVLGEGIPSLTEDIVCDLVQRGTIIVEGEKWRLVGAAPEVPIPRSAEQWAHERLSRLSPVLREVVNIASVAGDRFWLSMLQGLEGSRIHAADIHQLIDEGFFEERGEVRIEGEPDLAFRRPLDRLVSYQRLESRRPGLHRAIARWLERQTRGMPSRFDEEIAFHFGEAGEPARAIGYLRRAAERALGAYTIKESTRLLETLRSALLSLRPDAMSEARRRSEIARVTAELVELLLLGGEKSRPIALAEEQLARVLPRLAPAPEPRGEAEAERANLARIAVGLGWAFVYDSKRELALAAFERALLLAGPEPTLERLRALTGRAWMTCALGERDGASADIRAALRVLHGPLYTTPEWARALSTAHRMLCNIEVERRDLAAAQEAGLLAHELALSANAPLEVIEALNSLGLVHYHRGDLDAAETTARAALTQAEQFDLVQKRSILLGNVGELVHERGAHRDALALLQRAEELHHRAGSEKGLADTLRVMAECHAALGDLQTARAKAAESLDFASRARVEAFVWASHLTLANIEARRANEGAPDAARCAEEHFQEAIALLEKNNLPAQAESARATLEAWRHTVTFVPAIRPSSREMS